MYEPNIIIAITEGGLVSLSFAWFVVIFFYSFKDKLDEQIKLIKNNRKESKLRW